MHIILRHEPDCFEFLPSISVQRCFGKCFWTIALFTFSIEIGPDQI